ncbi:hypothetical protein HV213_13820 [Klebsiella sp. RHBSTW-00484]|uniref:hypothetical protein n=1 Tax=unclassified Klebsiella TaxID=2608929 RepID=UPI0015E53BD9|nr:MULTISPECIES: hypothetical protein [unclassified Klebsiella]MBA7847293.1 hypothetical protein [Klebsiella sp. RHBSTW-00465]QLO36822.1 hypothetical protein HV213_13820 [Klebsiella sp. RHBSTW-00484]QLT76340.1 hypothetical protein HV204_13820 [Klebsiella sp. RHBSTW-00464]
MNKRIFITTRYPVSAQHARPPIEFLDQIVDTLDALPDDVFAENKLHDIYAVMKGALGPYTSLAHRKAVMCEVLRVQAGFESDWRWSAGVDKKNHRSLTHIESEEAGAFQVSFDSIGGRHSALFDFAKQRGIDTAETFITKMKEDHDLAVEYCARLLRINTTWCGTIKDPSKVISHVRRDAVEEFQTFLSLKTPPQAMFAKNTVLLSDKEKIIEVMNIARTPSRYDKVQEIAAIELFKLAHEHWPHDGCALNLSNLLQEGDIAVPDIMQALALGNYLHDHRQWTTIPVGQQQPGDVGSTCGPTAHHGYDHIYLVLERIDDDKMIIADNQKPVPHERFASGKGRTPTKFFLRPA